MELFLDTKFADGFTVTGDKTDIPLKGMIYPPQKKNAVPKWSLAQWACRNDLLNGKVENMGNDSYCISTPSQKVTVNNGLTLELKASEEYKEHIRKNGEDWPHLLVEQRISDYTCPYLSEVKELRLKIESCLVYSNCRMDSPDESLHCCQMNMYFTIANKTNGDFLWFGVPFYDSRYTLQHLYRLEDIGKDDASHKFIFRLEQKSITSKPFSSMEWILYDFDMLPFIKEAFVYAQYRGYLLNCQYESMKITSMNFGWEMTGIYDGSLEFRDLSLDAK